MASAFATAAAIATALTLYKEYTDDKKYVFYKQHNIIIIMKVEGILKCLSEVEPKKYYCDSLKVILMYQANDPYKLVSHVGKYKIDETVSSYCYLSIEVLYHLYAEYYYDSEQKEYEFYNKLYITSGLHQMWYYSGKIKSEVNYVNNKREGLFIGWYENGQIHKKGYYVNGQMEGLYQEWYDNGAILLKANYVNDKMSGLYTSFYRDGYLKRNEIL